MSSGVNSNIQDQEQKTGNDDTAARAYIETALKNLHTCLPGIIASYDPATQTASVQPAIQRIFTGTGAVNLPVCVDVPVAFPGGGDFYLTFPVQVGNECILFFSERCIDFWFENGGVQLPAEYRLHDLSDAMAVVGINSQAKKLTNVQTDGAELRTRDRTTYIKLTEGKIFIKGDVQHDGNLVRTGNETITGDVARTGNVANTGTLQNNGHAVGSTHQHTNTQPGAGLSGVPQ